MVFAFRLSLESNMGLKLLYEILTIQFHILCKG
jgi:hypothetical protein